MSRTSGEALFQHPIDQQPVMPYADVDEAEPIIRRWPLTTLTVVALTVIMAVIALGVWVAGPPAPDAASAAATSAETSAEAASTRDPFAYNLYAQALAARNLGAGNWFDPEAHTREAEQILSAAIERDAAFAEAYAERATVQMALYVRNLETSADHVNAIRADVAAAARLAPTALKTRVARAWQLAFLDGDPRGAAAAFTEIEAAGLERPLWLLDTSRVLARFDDEPVARQLGWIGMLRGDRAAAAQHGSALLDFVRAPNGATPELRQTLEAEARTFTGERELALAAARELAARSPVAAAALYAWNGAHDDAVALLEKTLLEEAPAAGSDMGRALIARDPLVSLPLEGSARFRALVTRLEAAAELLASTR